MMPLGDLVIWLANRGQSGLLTVERGTVRKQFLLKGGLAIRASSNDPREYFGQFLVHFGLLTEDQLQRAFETQSETKVYLGRILVMIGIVPEEHVVQTLRVKISESLLDAFRWRVGQFHFDDAIADETRPEIDVAVPLVGIHREGIRRASMWDQFAKIFPSQGLVLFVHEARVPPEASTDTLDGRILALARHGLSIEAISLELHATDYQVAARLFELYRAGVIEPRESSEGATVPDLLAKSNSQTHAELAKRALADRDYSSAFRHVEAHAAVDPGNKELTALSLQIEGMYRADLQSGSISRDAVPVLARQLDEGQAKRLSAKQRYILARIDGKRSVQAIIQVSPMRDMEALDIIMQLRREGVIRF